MIPQVDMQGEALYTCNTQSSQPLTKLSLSSQHLKTVVRMRSLSGASEPPEKYSFQYTGVVSVPMRRFVYDPIRWA